MKERVLAILAVALLGIMIPQGCGSRQTGDPENAYGADRAALQLESAVDALAEVAARIQVGQVEQGREAYLAFADAYGPVLQAVRLIDGDLAGVMSEAGAALQTHLQAPEVDRQAVAMAAHSLREALRQAEVALAGGPVATASAVLGSPDPEQAPTGPHKAVPVEVKAIEYKFIPDRIEVEQGSLVRLWFTNTGTTEHEFELEGYGIEIEPIAPGATRYVTFVADKAGRFEYACHVDDHYEKGMRGELIVK